MAAPAPWPTGVLHALCYEHHTEMEMRQSVTHGHATPMYVCGAPGCVVGYNASRGYFLNKEGSRSPMEPYTVPRMPCPSDAQPMYLAEVPRERPPFLLWRCPKCKTSRLSGKFYP